MLERSRTGLLSKNRRRPIPRGMGIPGDGDRRFRAIVITIPG
jgi:hypothetical protein